MNPKDEKPKPPKAGRRSNGASTIHDVARRADVSPMTVSRVINGEKNVRDETRVAVMKAVAELNYVPNPAARSLAGSDGVRIGLLYSNPSSAYLSEFLVGTLDQATRKAARIMLEKCDGGATAQIAAVRRLINGGIDAALLPPPIGEAEAILAELLANELPVVAVACGRANVASSCVRIDDYAAAAEMTEYLLSLGHTRIGFIRGNPNQSVSSMREKGFVTAMQRSGLAFDPALLVQGYFSYRSGMDAAMQLLSLDRPPTAIFASNDDMAAAAVAAAHHQHIDVPTGLSVVGFDDTSIATTIWPELTTIHQPVASMAEIAIDLAVRAVRKRRTNAVVKPVDHLVSYSLVKRQSAGEPHR
jgi:LacI family transcriptional regulator